MIRICIRKKNDEFTGFLMEGHADYADEGQDIVCAAVSALAINTVNSLGEFTDDDFSAEESEEGGFLKLTLTPPLSEKARVLMDSLVLGLTMIEEEYGRDFLQVSIEG